MRNVFVSLILVLIFCATMFAQTNEISPCPTIDITESFENFSDNTIIYTADVSIKIDKYKVKYKWTVKGGEVVEGQATKIVRVKQSTLDGITVSLEIEGLPRNCSNTASTLTNITVCRLPRSNRKIDEFSTSASQIDKERLDELVTELQNNPNALVQIIERFSSQTSPKTIERKNYKIINYLKTKGITKEQFELLNASSDKNLTEFFTIPPGATPPICGNCVTVQLK